MLFNFLILLAGCISNMAGKFKFVPYKHAKFPKSPYSIVRFFDNMVLLQNPDFNIFLPFFSTFN